MIRAVLKALTQLFDPRITRVLLMSLCLTTGLFIALVLVLWWCLESLTFSSISWLNSILEVFSGLGGTILLALLFYPSVITACSSLFLDDIANTVDARHYPHLPAPHSQSFLMATWYGVRFALLSTGLNLIMLPLYIFLPGFNLILFWALNGYLISWEYFEIAALRRADPYDIPALRKKNVISLWALGIIIAFTMTIPFVNIFSPVIGIAAMVHMTQRIIETNDQNQNSKKKSA